MTYDFETLISRKNTGSAKWEQMYNWNSNVTDDIVPLSVADMEFKTMPEIVSGLKGFLDTAILGYAQSYPKFIDAVISWCNRHYDYQIQKEWIVNTPGVVNALFAAVNAFTDIGDGVLIMRPVYYPFTFAIEKNKRNVINCPLIERSGRYYIDFDKFDELSKDPKVKLMIFCSPHNPIGRIWTKEELNRLCEIAIKNDLIIVSDEIHCDLVMPGYHHTTMSNANKEITDRLITCFAPSKTFNLAGLCESNIIVPNNDIRKKFVEALDIMRSTSVNIFGYKACELAYTQGENWLKQLINVLDTNQRLVKSYFTVNFPNIKAPLIEGTYLQWIDLRCLGLSDQEQEKFMHFDAEFFGDEGYVFGKEGSGFVRINLAAPTTVIEHALDKLGHALTKIYKR